MPSKTQDSTCANTLRECAEERLKGESRRRIGLCRTDYSPEDYFRHHRTVARLEGRPVLDDNREFVVVLVLAGAPQP
jgi:hypothetical protein